MKFDVGGNNREKLEETVYTGRNFPGPKGFCKGRFCLGFLMLKKNVPMIIGFPQNGSPFVELIVLAN